MSERMKRNIYCKADGLPYFWRTTDKIEVDYIETVGNNLKAYEFKFNPNKKSRVTKAFSNRYPNAELSTITSGNYDSFLGMKS